MSHTDTVRASSGYRCCLCDDQSSTNRWQLCAKHYLEFVRVQQTWQKPLAMEHEHRKATLVRFHDAKAKRLQAKVEWLQRRVQELEDRETGPTGTLVPVEGDVCYFVLVAEGVVKIGTTSNLLSRLGGLVSGYGSAKVLAWQPGTRADERKLHERFRSLNIRRTPEEKMTMPSRGPQELFRLEPPLTDYIEELLG